MRIYISGPITGTQDARERFEAAARLIQGAGHVPVNPVYMADILPDGGYIEYMEIDLKLLELSDAVLMLEGWVSSRGARWEKSRAEFLRMPVIYEGRDFEAWVKKATRSGRQKRQG